MSTSVKLSEDDKKKLERLQAMVTVKTSKRVTQQKLLSRLIEDALEQGDEFIAKTFQGTVPMPNDDYHRMLSLISDWGTRTKWEEIDEVLYGDSRRRGRKAQRPL
ncbi:MAG: hypothetical protein JRN15_15570 [Nitrososphaerota archaeon]|nr:hypothetical protein [Nitrososphaerota archaeon]